MSGWVKLHRSVTEWEWYADLPCRILFLHLLISANHKPGRFMGHDITPGSLPTGLQSLAEKSGLSVQKVRTALEKLKNTGEITIKTTNKFSIITITKWEKYQSDNKRSTNDQQTDNKRITNDQQQYKNERKKEYISPENLSVEHIADWLQAKRVAGKYLTVDEHALLERFKNYCEAKKPKYVDYVAAFRNAFEWKDTPKKSGASWQPF